MEESEFRREFDNFRWAETLRRFEDYVAFRRRSGPFLKFARIGQYLLFGGEEILWSANTSRVFVDIDHAFSSYPIDIMAVMRDEALKIETETHIRRVFREKLNEPFLNAISYEEGLHVIFSSLAHYITDQWKFMMRMFFDKQFSAGCAWSHGSEFAESMFLQTALRLQGDNVLKRGMIANKDVVEETIDFLIPFLECRRNPRDVHATLAVLLCALQTASQAVESELNRVEEEIDIKGSKRKRVPDTLTVKADRDAWAFVQHHFFSVQKPRLRELSHEFFPKNGFGKGSSLDMAIESHTRKSESSTTNGLRLDINLFSRGSSPIPPVANLPGQLNHCIENVQNTRHAVPT